MLTMDTFSFAGKKALVRVDLNVPQDATGKVTDDTRARAIVPIVNKVLKDGGSAKEYFQNLHDRQMREEDLYTGARDAVVGLVKEGNVKEAKQALDELNAHMKSQGLPPVTVPPPYRKALGIQPGRITQEQKEKQ